MRPVRVSQHDLIATPAYAKIFFNKKKKEGSQIIGAQLTTRQYPPSYVRQLFVDPSYIPAELPNSWVQFNVDMRPLTYVYHGEIKTKSVIWGRANIKIGGMLNNVSQGAYELIVTIPQNCHDILEPYKDGSMPTDKQLGALDF